MFGVKGAPKCMVAMAFALGALAAATNTSWGPPPAQDAQADAWARVQQGTARPYAPFVSLPRSRVLRVDRARAVVRSAAQLECAAAF